MGQAVATKKTKKPPRRSVDFLTTLGVITQGSQALVSVDIVDWFNNQSSSIADWSLSRTPLVALWRVCVLQDFGFFVLPGFRGFLEKKRYFVRLGKILERTAAEKSLQ